MAVSGRVPQSTGTEHGSAPLFFLSYARHHRSAEDKAGAADPDRWTRQFFDDLTYEVAELTTLPHECRPGFMDREVRLGQEWRRRISEALAASRVFLPLYTPRYFASLSCASEWYLFQARQSAHELTSGIRPEAIIPVLWLPMPDSELPAAARALQFDHHALGEAYARLGFLQLIRVDRYKDEYQLAIHALAREVVRVALSGAPQVAMTVDFTALRSRFEKAEELFDAAEDLGRRFAGRTPLSLPGRQQLALPPGQGATATSSAVPPSGEEAVAAYIRSVQAKLTEWFATRAHLVASTEFDDFYFREVHPAAKAALLRHLPPHAPEGPAGRPPRLRSSPQIGQPPGGAPHAL